MLTRLRSTWLAGGGAMLLILSLSGIAAGATLVADTTDPVVDPADPAEGTTDTTLTFEDVDGNGVDDDCQDVTAVENADAVAAAMLAADLNGDGTISVSEAAQSDWTGGKNCNHGGYVSGVAKDSGDSCDDAEAPAGVNTGSGEDADEGEGTAPSDETAPVATCDETDEPTDETDETKPAAQCPAAEPVPPAADTPVDTAPNAHGKAVSRVAQSDAVGGKNCNHGGAVSEAAKKDHSTTQDKATHDKAAKKAHGKGQGKGHGASN